MVRADSTTAEAGYPNGFSLKLECPNDRYVNDAGTVGALRRVEDETVRASDA